MPQARMDGSVVSLVPEGASSTTKRAVVAVAFLAFVGIGFGVYTFYAPSGAEVEGVQVEGLVSVEYAKTLRGDKNEGTEFRPIRRARSEKQYRPPSGKPGQVAVGFAVITDTVDLEGAALLLQSIRMTSPKVDFDPIALVHSSSRADRAPIKALGYKVLEFDQPVYSAEIREGKLQEMIDTSGSHGTAELLSLRAFQLTQYAAVLLVDIGSLLVKNIDEVFSAVAAPGGPQVAFVYERSMANQDAKLPPIHPGFILARPNATTYKGLVSTVRKGDFVSGSGWAGSGVGWSYGGQTIRGLLPYYFNHVESEPAPLVLGECEYSVIGAAKVCKEASWSGVKHVNLASGCDKPSKCQAGQEGICRGALSHWWAVRSSLEESLGQSPTPRCLEDDESTGGYKPISLTQGGG